MQQERLGAWAGTLSAIQSGRIRKCLNLKGEFCGCSGVSRRRVAQARSERMTVSLAEAYRWINDKTNRG